MPAAQVRVGVLIDDGFDDDEFPAMTRHFENANARVTVVGPFPERVYSGRRGQVSVASDVGVRAIRAQMLSALVIPGGYAADRLRMRHAMLDLVRDALGANIPVGAIGHGPQLLISANAIAGRTITCWPSIAIDVKNAGGLYVDRPVVEDRGVITARKVDDVGAFVATILRAILSNAR